MIKFKVIIFLAIVLTCNGHLRLLGDILSSTHEKIHSTVHDVAGTVLGGLSHGINLNIDSHVIIKDQRRPDPGHQYNPHHNGYNQHPQTVDKVIVIIEEEDNNRRPDNYHPNRPSNQRPNYDNYGQGNYNNWQSNYVKPNNQNQGDNCNQGQYGRPINKNPNNQNQGDNYNQGQYGRPINKNPNNQNQGDNYNQGQYGRPINKNPNNQNQGDNYNQGQYGRPINKNPNNQNQGDNYNHGQYGRPINKNPNNQNQEDNYNQGQYGPINNINQNNQPNIIPEQNNFGNQETHYGTINTPVPEELPTPPSYPPVEEITTKKPDTDEPFFVPLSPDEYTYGGQRINITEPKRETNKQTQKELEDGVGNIDIRFSDD